MKRFFIGLFSIMGVASLWILVWQEFETSTEPSEEKINEKTPEFIINNFESRQFSIEGELESFIKAEQLVKYALSDNSSLDQPVVEYSELQSDQLWKWTILANKGNLKEKEKTLALSGEVNIQRKPVEAVNDPDVFELHTSLLYLDLGRKTFSSNREVEMVTDFGQMTATGMSGSLGGGKVRLHSNVNGRYAVTGFAP